MSSITRAMLNLPFAPGTKVKRKVVGDIIYTRAHMPDGTTETSIIKKTSKGLDLLKSVIIGKNRATISRAGQNPLVVDRKSGRVFIG